MTSENRKRPNIVVIMSDQHNPHIMGRAGNEIVRTPNLDRLAEEGTYFSNAYTPAPLCVPARMAFMTGEYASDIRVWSNSPSRLCPNIATFAHALGGAGYEAVLSGRMHFAGFDQFHGFEKRLFGDCWRYLTPETIGNVGNLEKAKYRTTGAAKFAVEVAGFGKNGYLAFDKKVTEKSCEFISTHNSDDRPYCLVTGFMAPHNPLICNEELFKYYFDKLSVPDVSGEGDSSVLSPAMKKWSEVCEIDGITPEQHHRALAAYYSLIEEMDSNVGKIIDAVKKSDEAENTILIYVSDHGDMATEHGGLWWKSCFFEEAAGIPMIISNPALSNQPDEVKSIVSLIDVTATILDFAQCDVMADMSGRSLKKFLEEDESKVVWENETFSEVIGGKGFGPSCMLRRDEWKLIYYSDFDCVQLFNLEEDPAEKNDRSEDPSCCEIVKNMLEKIHSRWSAERMIKEYAKERRNHAIIDKCGHDLFPHHIEDEAAPPGVNSFDYDQLPDSESIKRKLL